MSRRERGQLCSASDEKLALVKEQGHQRVTKRVFTRQVKLLVMVSQVREDNSKKKSDCQAQVKDAFNGPLQLYVLTLEAICCSR